MGVSVSARQNCLAVHFFARRLGEKQHQLPISCKGKYFHNMVFYKICNHLYHKCDNITYTSPNQGSFLAAFIRRCVFMSSFSSALIAEPVYFDEYFSLKTKSQI